MNKPQDAPDEALARLRKELDIYEQRHGLKSVELEAALATEMVEETFEMCSWLLSYKIWSHITAVVTLADDKLTMKDCPACPMYRPGSRPYCAKTGRAVRLEDPLPLVCRAPLKAKGV